MKKKEVKTYSNDEVRQKIITFLGECHRKARGLDSLSVTISKIKSALRSDGIKQNETVRNLDYLVQHGWVDEKIVSRPYTTPKGIEIPNEKHLFGLSEIGLKYIEGESIFDRTSIFSGINITNIGGVTVVGNHNIIRNEFMDVLRALNQLERAVKISDEVPDEQKIDVQSDIQTMKNQLSKTQPNKNILKECLKGLSFLAAVPGVVDFFQKAAEIVQRIF